MKLHQLLNKYQKIDSKDIILLLEKILNTSYGKLFLKDNITLSKEQETKLENYIERLKNHEPVQYILGFWDFIDIKLKVDKRALIPRPETEILALEGIELAEKFDNPKILDVGCGTGCIGLYIKYILPHADVTLCDISIEAAELAKENACLLNLDVEFMVMDMQNIIDTYDVIISNPPYITKEDMERLDSSVIEYEPKTALYGGVDGLEFYKTLSLMHNNLNDGGYLAVEIGINQHTDIEKLFSANFTKIVVKKDLSNISRVIFAKKK